MECYYQVYLHYSFVSYFLVRFIVIAFSIWHFCVSFIVVRFHQSIPPLVSFIRHEFDATFVTVRESILWIFCPRRFSRRLQFQLATTRGVSRGDLSF